MLCSDTGNIYVPRIGLQMFKDLSPFVPIDPDFPDFDWLMTGLFHVIPLSGSTKGGITCQKFFEKFQSTLDEVRSW